MPKGRPEKGYALTPQREKVLRILAAEGGSLDDEAGLVVSRLRERTGHDNTQALSMVIKQLETSGLIKRDVAGRRTYHIELVPDALAPEDRERLGLNGKSYQEAPVVTVTHEPSPILKDDEPAETQRASGDVTDYRRLADELLKAALAAVSKKGAADPAVKLKLIEAEGRLAEERVRLDDLAAQLLQRGNELLEAKALIRTLEHNLEVERKKHATQASERGSDPIEKRLTDRERQELAGLKRMMESKPGA